MPLTTTDKRDLQKLEAIVERGFVSAFEGGRAMREIRDRKLYLESHESFDSYCESRWDCQVRNAELRMNASRVRDILEAHKCALLPRFEAQTRPLHKENNEDIPDIWESAVKLAGGQRITEAIVEQAVRAWNTSDDEPPAIEVAHEEVDEEETPPCVGCTDSGDCDGCDDDTTKGTDQDEEDEEEAEEAPVDHVTETLEWLRQKHFSAPGDKAVFRARIENYIVSHL